MGDFWGEGGGSGDSAITKRLSPSSSELDSRPSSFSSSAMVPDSFFRNSFSECLNLILKAAMIFLNETKEREQNFNPSAEHKMTTHQQTILNFLEAVAAMQIRN